MLRCPHGLWWKNCSEHNPAASKVGEWVKFMFTWSCHCNPETPRIHPAEDDYCYSCDTDRPPPMG